MERIFLVIGSVMGALGVGAGAFAAHGLKTRVTLDLLAVFETGARYQLIHALALLAVGLVMARSPHLALTISGWLFTGGILVFSGSLYILALSGVRWIGAITPIGGAAMIAGWLCLAWGVISSRRV